MKACGADAAKFQWTSDPLAMAARRHGLASEFEILAWPVEWLAKLKAHCDEVGIEFMCTVFLAEDIPVVAPLVRRFKVASAESGDVEFVGAHQDYGREIIISYAFGIRPNPIYLSRAILCVCSYPTPIEQLNLARIEPSHIGESRAFDGLSDHTTSVLTGALAVARGGTHIEKHVRLHDTPSTNPDFPHSLEADRPVCIDPSVCGRTCSAFGEYVAFVREAERAMGTGNDEMQECEKPFESRRVK